MALSEQTIPNDQIMIDRDGNVHVREATIILNDGKPDERFSPQYHRYVLSPGDDLSVNDASIVAVAKSAWTPEVVSAYRTKRAAEAAAVKAALAITK